MVHFKCLFCVGRNAVNETTSEDDSDGSDDSDCYQGGAQCSSDRVETSLEIRNCMVQLIRVSNLGDTCMGLYQYTKLLDSLFAL